ncbi:hypothetical protein [Methylophilus sp. QUAN]|uniref:hypothetical protein n=1 Tax=Methylophilus sp. QUAN TaxID=2781020 RepID=UPI00188F4185|nr:hypothetical protein [Methylophilus sp. QUAN]MBF4991117.1 hypothetical protein [Methylophilus sp. QUAN]
MTDLIEAYSANQALKANFEASDKAFYEKVCNVLDGLYGTAKNDVRGLGIIKLCIDIQPDFKSWLEDKFYKYEGGTVDIEDVSSLGTSVMLVLGYDQSRYEVMPVMKRLKQ